MDVRVQQDASEFLTNFFQQLEGRMSGSSHAELLKSTFGGVELHELRAGERYSSRQQGVYFLT